MFRLLSRLLLFFVFAIASLSAHAGVRVSGAAGETRIKAPEPSCVDYTEVSLHAPRRLHLEKVSSRPPNASDPVARWKGRPFVPEAGGLYDMRARWWSPSLGVFLSIDNYEYYERTSTLWGWPGQNPLRWRDPTGHEPWGGGDDVILSRMDEVEPSWTPSDTAHAQLGYGLGAAAGYATLGAGAVFAETPLAAALARSPLGRMVLRLLTSGAGKKLADKAQECPSLPTLSQGPGGRMLGEAVGHLKGMASPDRIGAFRQFASQITSSTNGQWSAKELSGANATIFAGEGGEALVFDAAGNMFRGQLADRAAFAFLEGGQVEVNFSLLRAIK